MSAASQTSDPVAVGRPDRPAQLIAAARHLLETDGFEAVTIRRLGAALGMRGPSIYKHFPSKAAIETALAAEVLAEQADLLETVPATFADIARAYRGWALSNPQLHRLINTRPLARDDLPPGLEERAAAPLIIACHGDRALARAAWATLKGLVDLELDGRFPEDADIDAAYSAAARAYGDAADVEPATSGH